METVFFIAGTCTSIAAPGGGSLRGAHAREAAALTRAHRVDGNGGRARSRGAVIS
jgi:hypothetical protein